MRSDIWPAPPAAGGCCRRTFHLGRGSTGGFRRLVRRFLFQTIHDAALLGANVTGPAATTAEATKLMTERLPHVALVDFHLRGEDHLA